jgi:hypothetical protein
VLPNTLAVLLHAVPADRRGATIATWASMTGIGGAVGNIGGGAVLSGGSWRWLFATAVAVSLVLAAFVGRVAPVSSRHDRRLDPLGTVLLVAASVALLVAIVQGPEAGWGSAVVVCGFVSAAVLFAVWTIVELKVEHPLLDPRLFRIAGLRSACLGMTAVFFGMFALFYVNASFLQYGKGFSVLRTGLGILPLTVPIILGGRHVGRLARRIGSGRHARARRRRHRHRAHRTVRRRAPAGGPRRPRRTHRGPGTRRDHARPRHHRVRLGGRHRTPRHPELFDEVRRAVIAPHQELVMAVLLEALDRGEAVPGRVTERVAAVGPKLVVSESWERGRVDDTEVEAIVDEVLVPILSPGG